MVPLSLQEPPSTIGPYRIAERLGRGGMGVVFRGIHADTGEVAAVKTVRLPSARHLAAIRREIQALARVQHPGVVRIVGEGIGKDGLPWYAMELLRGMTLREYRFAPPAAPAAAPDDQATASGSISVALLLPTGEAERPIAPSAPNAPNATASLRRAALPTEHLTDLLTIFRRLCEPLAYVHGEGLVHCDLKPENIFLRYGGRPVLVDFGLMSRFGGAHAREVLDVDLFMGTAEYMAPEQWDGKPVDARSDLYALGCILFECLVGRPPFRGARDELYRAHTLAPPPRASELVSGVPPALDDLMVQLLQKKPGDRLGHAEEVARVLAELGAEGPREPSPTPRPYLFRPSFTGRSRATTELAQLISTDSDDGRLVLLGGESGVGKTRLATESARLARRGGIRVLTGECVALAPSTPGGSVIRGAPLHPFRSVLLALADRCHETGGLRLGRQIAAEAKLLARVQPALNLIPGAPALPEPPPLPSEAERDRLIAAMTSLLGALGRDGRTFIILDDLQWADELSLEVLRHLAAHPREWQNVVILGTFRVEEPRAELEAIAKQPAVGLQVLSRLTPAALEHIIGDMLGFCPPADFVEFLAEESEGNPFFVAEYLRAAVGRGLLVRDGRGKWVVGARGGRHAYEALGLPRTLRDLVAHRIDSLEVTGKAFVEAAAVLGREADPELTASVSHLGSAEVDEAITELLHKQVLEEAESGRLRFSHDKLREVAYTRLADAPKRSLHRRAAEVLEARLGREERDTTFAPILANHWEAAGEVQAAIHHLENAADASLSAGAYREAASFLRRAMQLAKAGPVELEAAREASWCRKLGASYLAQGALADSRAQAERSLELLGVPCPKSRSRWLLALARELLAQLAHRTLHPRFYTEPARRASLVEATHAAAVIARVAFFENDVLRNVTTAVWSINLAERAGELVEAARNYSGLGWVFGLSRLHGVADGYFERARAAGEASSDWAGLLFALTSEALYRTGRAQWDRVAAALAACERPCELLRDPQSRELVDTLLGHPAYFGGRFEASLAHHSRALSSARGRENRQHQAWSLYCMARALLPLGRVQEARTLLSEAADLLAGQADQMSEIACHGLSARAHLFAGEHLAAVAAADLTDQKLGRTPPMIFLTLHGHEGVAEVRLAAWAQARERGVPEAARLGAVARRATRRLVAFSAAFPLGRPRALLLEGRRLHLAGSGRRARRTLRRGIEAAQRAALPYDEALLWLELSQVAGRGTTEGAEAADRARQLCDGLGVPPPTASV